MGNASAIWQQAASHHLPSFPSRSTRASHTKKKRKRNKKEAYLLTKNTENFLGGNQQNGALALKKTHTTTQTDQTEQEA